MDKMETVFFPFWMGRYRCVGERLAMLQLRLVISQILGRFRIEFADGWDEERVCVQEMGGDS